ncbi:MAG: MBOAT family O-acyltransferase [Lachnospiraceae bacterium]|nr:MBOAT family O-acyltransferase [Lachnospiraceae bacterium]
MVFSSLEFLFMFLPIFFLIYFLIPEGRKNLWLLLGSLFFYWYGVKDHPVYLLLIIASIGANDLFGRKISVQEEIPRRRIWLTVGLVYNFGWLFLFKYAGFLTDNINSLFKLSGQPGALPGFHPVLPVGISFYTFQITSYLMDVYRKKIPAEESILRLGTYLCMFPQLIAGPIVTYSEVAQQLKERVHSLSNMEEGLRTFTIGLGYKVLLANSFGAFWSDLNTIGFDSLSTPLAWLGIIGYSLQIYFDFYGYSLMAMGLGHMMGFTIPENFRFPYMACSMTDFWRRWHITLGSWFREYVYIPLGGNRCSLGRHTLNMLAVWLLTGLWHGASWNFILWGGILFLIMLFEKKGLKKHLDAHPAAAHIYMCFLIPFTWLFFAITDFSQLGIYLGKLFPFLGTASGAVYAGDFEKYLGLYGPVFAAGLVFCTGWPEKLYRKYQDKLPAILMLLLVFWACVYCMYLGMDDPFLYYRF